MMPNLCTGGSVYVDASQKGVRWVHNFLRFSHNGEGQCTCGSGNILNSDPARGRELTG